MLMDEPWLPPRDEPSATPQLGESSSQASGAWPLAFVLTYSTVSNFVFWLQVEIVTAPEAFGVQRKTCSGVADEGAAAHIWQLLMAGQLPVIAFYVVKWVPKDRIDALRVLALQAGAALAALAPVYWLGL